MLGGSFLLGGLKHHVQEFNRVNARLQASLLFLATVGLLVPSLVTAGNDGTESPITDRLSVALAVLLIVTYGLGLFFSLKTHRELFAAAEHESHHDDHPVPLQVAVATLVVVTVLVALVSEVFVATVQQAAVTFGMTPALVGFIIVALVSTAAEILSAWLPRMRRG
jgi:Ca2+:H+ antiporter